MARGITVLEFRLFPFHQEISEQALLFPPSEANERYIFG